MSYWWSSYGKFAPDQSRLYPVPEQVLMRYRTKAGLSRKELATLLGIGEKMVYYAETKGGGLDNVSRLRELCMLLAIPHALFGLCAIPTGEAWWVKEYGTWQAGADGWPKTGAVVKWYRLAKRWTQIQLADAMHITEREVRNMEKEHIGLDSLSRRRSLQFLLSIPPLLLGLDAVHLPPSLSVAATPTRLSSAPQLPSLENAQTFQARLWSGYYTGHAQEKVPQVRGMLTRIDEVLLQAPEIEIPAWLEVQSLGYQWLGNVLRDTADPRVVLAYNQKAVEQARQTGNANLLSIALIRQMESAYHLGLNEQAVQYAQGLTQIQVPDPVLNSGRAMYSARVLSLAVGDQADRSQVLRLVEQCQTFGNTYNINNTPEVFTRRHAEVLLNLASSARDRARLLTQASDLLERLEPTQFDIRYQIEVLLALAQVALARKEYDQATAYALDAWPLVNELQNWRKLPQFTEIYRALLQSSYASSPQVARLGLLLFQVGAV